MGEHKVVAALPLVRREAAVEVDTGVGRFVGTEHPVFPLAISLCIRVIGTPALFFLHHSVADNVVRLDEVATGILDRVTLRIELRRILHHRDNCAVGKRRAFFCRLDCCLAR